LEGAPAYSASEVGAWDDTRGRNVDTYYEGLLG